MCMDPSLPSTPPRNPEPVSLMFSHSILPDLHFGLKIHPGVSPLVLSLVLFPSHRGKGHHPMGHHCLSSPTPNFQNHQPCSPSSPLLLLPEKDDFFFPPSYPHPLCVFPLCNLSISPALSATLPLNLLLPCLIFLCLRATPPLSTGGVDSPCPNESLPLHSLSAATAALCLSFFPAQVLA